MQMNWLVRSSLTPSKSRLNDWFDILFRINVSGWAQRNDIGCSALETSAWNPLKGHHLHWYHTFFSAQLWGLQLFLMRFSFVFSQRAVCAVAISILQCYWIRYAQWVREYLDGYWCHENTKFVNLWTGSGYPTHWYLISINVSVNNHVNCVSLNKSVVNRNYYFQRGFLCWFVAISAVYRFVAIGASGANQHTLDFAFGHLFHNAGIGAFDARFGE